jgi:NADPH-dependent glutamate synthase beta subunit-like oxidoreductase
MTPHPQPDREADAASLSTVTRHAMPVAIIGGGPVGLPAAAHV